MEIFAENQFIVGGIYRVVEHFVTHKNSLAQIKKILSRAVSRYLSSFYVQNSQKAYRNSG